MEIFTCEEIGIQDWIEWKDIKKISQLEFDTRIGICTLPMDNNGSPTNFIVDLGMYIFKAFNGYFVEVTLDSGNIKVHRFSNIDDLIHFFDTMSQSYPDYRETATRLLYPTGLHIL